MSDLKPCPFCGGEASVKVLEYDDDCKVWGVFCESDLANEYSHGHFVDNYATEAEAIAAWNSRAPIEYEGWFYLPKPKEGIVDYGEPEITRTENGYKVRHFADVVDEAARRWGDELGDYVMKRICEAWNSRAERTCHIIGFDDGVDEGIDGEWHQYAVPQYDLSCGHSSQGTEAPNYCPNCGRKCI